MNKPVQNNSQEITPVMQDFALDEIIAGLTAFVE